MIGQHKSKVFGLGLLVFAIVATGCGPEMKRLRDERNALFEQNQEAQNLIDDLRRANDALNMENSTLRSDLAGASTAVDETAFDNVGGGVTASATDQAITVSVPGDLLFAPGKVALNNTSKSTLSSIASIIDAEYPGRRVRVEGYTDTDPIKKSGWVDNLQLSLERSAAVYRYLEEQGLPAELMYAAGFGAQKAKETKKLSRRVEIVVLLSGE
ncbi:OmpA/MotB family protein [Algisphaera agarilytica]|uniref:Flagellar motor protein MotB n=1 Tax=Algisphaera agarilytica TaxID=1385975 RepID=A0A7X0LJV6_9BACT|nr:OmpA family protein [Algisphaera agarilytica]MBB6428328.1 flagellar motor protein MotB [Algisphaera agarilytica]